MIGILGINEFIPILLDVYKQNIKRVYVDKLEKYWNKYTIELTDKIEMMYDDDISYIICCMNINVDKFIEKGKHVMILDYNYLMMNELDERLNWTSIMGFFKYMNFMNRCNSLSVCFDYVLSEIVDSDIDSDMLDIMNRKYYNSRLMMTIDEHLNLSYMYVNMKLFMKYYGIECEMVKNMTLSELTMIDKRYLDEYELNVGSIIDGNICYLGLYGDNVKMKYGISGRTKNSRINYEYDGNDMNMYKEYLTIKNDEKVKTMNSFVKMEVLYYVRVMSDNTDDCSMENLINDKIESIYVMKNRYKICMFRGDLVNIKEIMDVLYKNFNSYIIIPIYI